MAYETGTQIKAMAESLTEGDTISEANVILWINEFLTKKLRTKAMIKDTQDYISSAADTYYPLPADFEEVFKIDEYISSDMSEDHIYKEYFKYQLDDIQLKFQDAGHFRLHYFKLPTALTALTGNVEIDSCFYEACYTWVAYRALTNDDEDNAKNQSLGQLRYGEFLSALNEGVRDRNRKIRKTHRIRREP